jgi:flagellar M-ring protein FliF
MPGNRPKFVNQLLEMWSHLQWSQRLTIVFFAFLGLALIGSVVYFMNRVEYEVLFRDLNSEDANSVAAKLDEKKKSYQVQETTQGTSIKVAAPKDEVQKLRLELSGSGLARSGKPGYEIFDKNQFGMTDFTEQVNLQRALEGELARTISSLSEISQAWVHIVLRKDSYFQENKEEAKASVVIKLKKGAELSKSSIAGIKGVVAGAVSGLGPRNISVVDDQGRLLSQSVESGDEARADMEAGIRENLEKEMSGKVVSILEPLVGKGKVQANASIDLDFNSTELSEETYNPNQPVILSQQKSEERAGGQSSVSGVPGIQPNLGTTARQSSSPVPERVRQSEVTNYEVNKTVRHTIQPKGAIRRLSVAVILDHKTVWNKTKDGKVTSQPEPRSAQEIDKCRELVHAAVGFNEERGDVVKVENVAFYSESKPEETAPATPWYYRWQTQTYLMPAMKYVSFIILFFVAYLLFIRPIRKRVFQALSIASPELSESGEMALASITAPKALGEAAQMEQLSPADAASAAALPAGESKLLEDTISLETASDEQIERELIREASSVDMGNRKFAAMKKKLADKARKDPEMVSQLIRTFLRAKA